MSGEQFGGVLRAVLTFLAGFLPATFLNGETIGLVIGGIVTIGVALWSYYTNKPATPTVPPPV